MATSERPLVAVLDYGIGNLRSAQKGLERVGADARLTADRGVIADAAGVVLPGVGNFGRCAEELRAAGLEPVVHEAVESGRPFLGICIGMQLLYEGSDESPGVPGLGVLPGKIGLLPDSVKAINLLYKAAHSVGVPVATLELVHLRASQINGCGACVDSGARSARTNGETDERLFTVVAWRETPYFTDAERAALDLAESATRLADRADAVPDEIWEAAAKHYTEPELAALVLWIATTNFFNRLNVPTRQPAPQNWG